MWKVEQLCEQTLCVKSELVIGALLVNRQHLIDGCNHYQL